jgi:MFS superfamily sulfate permease-like transporter
MENIDPKLLSTVKDIFYLIGSCLGIITFFLTIKKRDKSIFTYRTEMGNEVKPMLICIRGSMYNVKVSKAGKSTYVYKLPQDFRYSSIKRNEHKITELDESSFFPSLKEGEALLVDNEALNLDLKVEFEDQFQHKYYQKFRIQKDQIGNPARFEKNKSQSLYRLSKRWRKRFWIWY